MTAADVWPWVELAAGAAVCVHGAAALVWLAVVLALAGGSR